MASAQIKSVVTKIKNIFASIFGPPASRPVLNDNEVAVKTSLQQCRELSKPAIQENIKSYRSPTNLEASGSQPYLDNAMLTLQCCMEAVQKVFPKDPDKIHAFVENKINNTLGDSQLGKPTAALAKNIHKDFTRAIDKYAKKENLSNQEKKELLQKFQTEFDKARGKFIPVTLDRAFKVSKDLGESYTLSEQSSNLDTSLGASYLEKAGLQENGSQAYQSQIEFIHEYQNCGVRTSPLKNQAEAQGMLINGRKHMIKQGQQEIAAVQRSGAFAIHGSGKIGLDRLKSIQEEAKTNPAALDKLGKLWKIHDHAEIEIKLAAEIKRRTDLTVAQALPKMASAIQDMLKDPEKLKQAIKTNEFFYVEQSFLSTGNAGERAMVEDMQGAINHIRENVSVRISTDLSAQGVEIDAQGKIIMTLYAENSKATGKDFKLNPVLFVHGVNEFQSIANVFNADAVAYQDSINAQGKDLLLKRAEDLGLSESLAIQNLGQHYSPENERRGKDMEGMRLVSQVTTALYGSRGINCKSGKDRTGTEANNTLAYAAVLHLAKHNTKFAPSDQSKAQLYRAIKRNLDGGISYAITGQNTGKHNAYAFNDFQYPTLPEAWRPRKDFCGNVPS